MALYLVTLSGVTGFVMERIARANSPREAAEMLGQYAIKREKFQEDASLDVTAATLAVPRKGGIGEEMAWEDFRIVNEGGKCAVEE